MRPPITTRLSGALLVAILALAPLGSARAGEPPQAAPPTLSVSLTGMAKAEYEGGKILFVDRDYQNALIKFEHAFALSKDVRLLWNIASCEKSLRHYTRVISLLERYQREGGALLTEEDRRDAKEILAIVHGLVSELRVMVSEPGAEVFIDDQKAGDAPLAPLFVDVGARKIRVQKPGFKTQTQTAQVAGGGAMVVTAKLERELHKGQLVIEAGAKDLIALDGKVVGLGRFEGAIPSGGHTLRVSAPGMLAYQAELTIEDDKTRRVPITLNAAPGSPDKTTWIWLTGGALLAAGAVVGSVFLFRPTETPAQGTIGTFPLSFGGKR
ncbi:MAG: PEGA domain-containing protein [Minicystis sp.]